MPHFDPTEFGRLLARLTPHELRQVEGLVADARKNTGPGQTLNGCPV